MTAPLYRPEATERLARGLAGAVSLPTLPAVRLLTAIASTATIGVIAFAALVPLPVYETAKGDLSPVGGFLEVTAAHGGQVSALRVKEGDQVQAGQILAILELGPRLESGPIGPVLERSFAAEARAARDENSQEMRALELERRTLVARLTSLDDELEETRRQLRIASDQTTLVTAEQRRGEELAARGFMTRRDLDQRLQSALAAEARESQIRNAVHGLERQRLDATARLTELPIAIDTLEARASASDAQRTQRAVEASAHNGYVVTAPISGDVVAAPSATGQALDAGDLLVSLMPAGAVLEAQLYVTPQTLTRLRRGQVVRLKYEGWPSARYGWSRGVVQEYARTAAPEDVVGHLGMSGPRYRVTVALDRQHVRVDDVEQALTPDMRLSAEILLERRTLLQRLVDPIGAGIR